MAINSTGSFGTPNKGTQGSQNNARGPSLDYATSFVTRWATIYDPSHNYTTPPGFNSSFSPFGANIDQTNNEIVAPLVVQPIAGVYEYLTAYPPPPPPFALALPALFWNAGGFDFLWKSSFIVTPGVWTMTLSLGGGLNNPNCVMPYDPSNIFTIEFMGNVLATFTAAAGWVSGAGTISNASLTYNFPPGTPNEPIYATAKGTLVFDSYALSPRQAGTMVYRSRGNTGPTFGAGITASSFGFAGVLTTPH